MEGHPVTIKILTGGYAFVWFFFFFTISSVVDGVTSILRI